MTTSDLTSVKLPFLSARKLSDPFNKSIITYEFRVDTRELPDFPVDANARPSDAAKTKQVYKSVRNSVLDGSLNPDEDITPGLFGYKHLGINVVADRVDEIDNKTAIIHFKQGQGVMNGGHGLAIIRELQQNPGISEMPQNFIKVSVVVGLPVDTVFEIAGANNTSVQVKQSSILELSGAFEPIKNALKDTPLHNNVQWREGEDGIIKVEELLAVMTCYRSDIYQPDDKKKMPIKAYSSKNLVLEDFHKDMEGYYALLDILPQILEFQDFIRTQPKKMYNEKGGRFGSLKFVESIYTDVNGERRKKDLPSFVMPVSGERVEHRLSMVAVYPIHAAFRQFVELKDDKFKWNMSFRDVKKFWEQIAVEVVESTRNTCGELKFNLNGLGKSVVHWGNVQDIVQKAITERENQLLRQELAELKNK